VTEVFGVGVGSEGLNFFTFSGQFRLHFTLNFEDDLFPLSSMFSQSKSESGVLLEQTVKVRSGQKFELNYFTTSGQVQLT
jgi:hypothetical protein